MAEMRSFDSRPLRSVDPAQHDLMLFPEFLWAIWNLAKVCPLSCLTDSPSRPSRPLVYFHPPESRLSAPHVNTKITTDPCPPVKKGIPGNKTFHEANKPLRSFKVKHSPRDLGPKSKPKERHRNGKLPTMDGGDEEATVVRSLGE